VDQRDGLRQILARSLEALHGLLILGFDREVLICGPAIAAAPSAAAASPPPLPEEPSEPAHRSSSQSFRCSNVSGRGRNDTAHPRASKAER
jgi:hypothetical protein